MTSEEKPLTLRDIHELLLEVAPHLPVNIILRDEEEDAE